MKNAAGVAGAAVCGLLLFASVFAPYEETEQHRALAMQPPTRVYFEMPSGRFTWPFVTYGAGAYPLRLFARSAHVIGVDAPAYFFLLGSDEYGRDLFSRLLYGGRRALIVGMVAVGTALFIGFAIGAVAGFYGGRTDALLMRGSELFLSLPWMYLLLAVRALLPLRLDELASLGTIVAVAALSGWPGPARLVRGIFLSSKHRPYISVSRSFGASNGFIIIRHILPEVRTVLWTQAATLLPRFMLVDVALSFLGLGESEPYATWGGMLASLRHFSTIESHGGYLMQAAAIGLILFLLQFPIEQKTKTKTSEAN